MSVISAAAKAEIQFLQILCDVTIFALAVRSRHAHPPTISTANSEVPYPDAHGP